MVGVGLPLGPSPQIRAHSPPQPEPISSLAAFAAEMVAWLWFDLPEKPRPIPHTTSPPAGPSSGSSVRLGSPEPRRPTKEQVTPTERFTRFTNDLLATSKLHHTLCLIREDEARAHVCCLFGSAQVSHSVVILALLYLARLKTKNPISPSPGSEFRLTVTALMIANKVLDDNSKSQTDLSDVWWIDVTRVAAANLVNHPPLPLPRLVRPSTTVAPPPSTTSTSPPSPLTQLDLATNPHPTLLLLPFAFSCLVFCFCSLHCPYVG